MKKNKKLLLLAGAAILALGLATAILLIFGSDSDNNSSEVSSEVDTTVALTSQNADDVSTLTVKNQKGEFVINRLGISKWGIDKLGEVPVVQDTFSASISAVAALNASQLVEASCTEMDKYGLDKPSAEFTITYKENKAEPITFCVGLYSESFSSYYVNIKGKTDVYIVARTGLPFIEHSDLSYINTTLVGAYDTEATPKIERVRINRKNLEQDIVLDVLPEVEEGQIADTYATYAFSSHNDILADDDKDKEVVYGIFGLTANGAVYANPTEAQYKETGLDDPFCTVSVMVEDEVTKLYIGNPNNSTSTTENIGGDETKVVSSYYCKIQGTEVIYDVPAESLPWLTAEVGDMIYGLFFTPYIYYLDSIDIKTADTEYNYKIIGEVEDEDNHTFVLNDKIDIDGSRFRSFYQYLLSAKSEEIYIQDLTENDVFLASITYTRSDTKAVDTIGFYQSGTDRKCIITVNGKVQYKCRQIYGTRLLDNIKAIAEGGEIVATF